MAAIGGTRTARRAGLMAEVTVTPTPTTSATTTVRASNTSGPDGSVKPNALSNASSPRAASTPRPVPMSEETTPTMAASPSTERKTWRRLAPTTRSMASSRARCPTVMEKVLKMVKAPTNSEIKANTSKAVEKNERAWSMELVCSLTTVWPVTTSAPGGKDRAMDRSTAALSAPGRVTTLMWSNSPTSSSTTCAVGRVKAATVTPARLSAVPNWTIPVMVKLRVGPPKRMRTCWPTLKWYFLAVPASINTS